jgi:4-diphosphocytidyl-2-C-methyl-D-erythritol kinase
VSAGKRVVVAAPAKINLFLHIGNRRADGYHNLESLVAFAAIGDVVSIESDDGISLAVAGPFADLLGAYEDNLVLRAARLLAAETKNRTGVQISLTKNLPVASGVGGGSADAAATLRGLARLWQTSLPTGKLLEIGESLGADVPVCVQSAPAWMEGKGERLVSLPPLPPLHLLLVNSGVSVPTGPVFASLRERRGTGLMRPESPFEDVATLVQFLRQTTNDLEGPAQVIAPEIGNVLEILLEQRGALFARMSGSGATCFAIFESEPELTKAAAQIAADHPDWWVRETKFAPESFAEPAFVQ